MKLLVFQHGQQQAHEVEIVDGETTRVDGATVAARPESSGEVRVDGRVAWTVADSDVRWVFLDGRVYEFAEASPKTRRRRSSHHGGLMSPMPATVRRILVAPGERVANGDVLLLLEAMKMELPIRAAGAGVVRAVHCKDGELVQPGVPLIDVEEDA